MLPSVFNDDLFDSFFNHPFASMNGGAFARGARGLMKTDVRELDKAYELDVELPGFKKDEITLELDGGYLSIKAEKKAGKDEKDDKGRYLRRERFAGACTRSFYVGEGLEPKDVAARFEDGMLRLTLPKETAKAQEKKQISVA